MTPHGRLTSFETRTPPCIRPRGDERAIRGVSSQHAHPDLKLEEDLRRAIDRGGFEIHNQPQVTLSTGTIAEMEALVRWGHPRRGLVMLSEFIQVTEETGLIVPIGERVLEEARRRAKASGYQSGYSHPITMCVNLSMRQLQDPDLVDKVERALRRAALDPNRLKLEIAETMVMED